MREKIIKDALSGRFGSDADAGQVANAILAALRLLHAELASLVGAQASGALVVHAVHRTRARVSWSMPIASAADEAMLAALQRDLAARAPAECLLAGETLMCALADHLVSLIGEPLTVRLLNAAWTGPVAGQSISGESLHD